ncbi:MAG: response regulator [Bacteroidia bacterium]
MNNTLAPILYAEDNENDIELTLAAFQLNGIKNPLIVVRDGQEVLDYLNYKGQFAERNVEHPVVILLDIKMPKVTGIEALAQIKSNEELKMIPVVMLTSSAMERDLVMSYELGVNAYIIKPIDFNEYKETVESIGSFWVLRNKTI